MATRGENVGLTRTHFPQKRKLAERENNLIITKIDSMIELLPMLFRQIFLFGRIMFILVYLDHGRTSRTSMEVDL